MAVLCGASVDLVEKRRIVIVSIREPDTGHRFTPFSLIAQHFVFRALADVEEYDAEFEGMWSSWRDMLTLDLTTWAEGDVSNRSDCHAWSSLPLCEIPAEVCGLKAAEPAFRATSFQPRVQLYKNTQFSVLLGQRGLATVKWERSTADISRVSLSLSCVAIVHLRDRSGEEKTHEVSQDCPLHVYIPVHADPNGNNAVAQIRTRG